MSVIALDIVMIINAVFVCGETTYSYRQNKPRTIYELFIVFYALENEDFTLVILDVPITEAVNENSHYNQLTTMQNQSLIYTSYLHFVEYDERIQGTTEVCWSTH